MTHTEHDTMAKVVRYFTQSKLTPLMIGASLLIGVFSVMNLAREEEPQISVPMFDLFVSFPATSPSEVEERIVNLGERKIWEIPGVEYIYSTSEADGALFIIRFQVGSNMEESLIKLYTKVYSNLDFLPPGASQPLIKLRSIDDVPVLALTFHSEARDPVSLRNVVSHVQRIVNTIPNVSETAITGGRKRQFQVFLDPQKLHERLLSPMEIQELIQQANVKQEAGHLNSEPLLIPVQADSYFRSVEDLRQLVVGVSGGTVIYLKDVADIRDGPDDEERDVLTWMKEEGEISGPHAAVTLSVSKRKGTNASRLCQTILDKIEALKGDVIPSDVHVTETRNYGKSANEKSNELLFHMAIAIFGVSLLIGFSLGWRESGVVAIAIPMTLALTLATFYFLGLTLNRITLFALIFSIGILVDDPIVDVENIVRHLRMPANKGRSILDITVEGVNEVRSPLILATLTVIAAILPMAFVSGLMGPYMRPIPIGSSFAMLFSMLVAFVATPWAAYRILGSAHRAGKLKGHGEGESEDFLTRLYRSYMKPLIYQAKVRNGFLAVLGLLLVLSISLIPLKAVRVKMLPFDNKNEFQVVMNLPEGTPVEKTIETGKVIAENLLSVPEVEHIQLYAGTSAPFNFNGLVRHYYLRSRPHEGDLQINLKEKHHRKRQSHVIADSVRPSVHAVLKAAGAQGQVAEVPPGPPVLSTLVLEVYGPGAEERLFLVKQIEAILSGTPGITDIDSYESEDEKQLKLKVLTEKASLNGIPVNTIVETVRTALEGKAVDLAHLENEFEPVEIRLRLPAGERETIDSILNLSLLSRYGNRIPLRDLVVLEEGLKDKPIYHKNLMPVSYVIADVTGELASPVYAILELKEKMAALVLPESVQDQTQVDQWFAAMPQDESRYALKWDGEWHITYEVFRDLGIAFAAVLILIYILVVAWFQSFKTPWIIMLPIPLTLIGILPAHGLTGILFTATSMIGLIAGAGIVVRNAIILVDFIELKRAEGLSLEESVIDAGAKRFRPMLLTASAVVVGAAVILFDPIFQGLALSLMAGEIASTVLSRTAVPVIYYLMNKHTAADQESARPLP